MDQTDNSYPDGWLGARGGGEQDEEEADEEFEGQRKIHFGECLIFR
jgi:hypothetical protein